MVTAADKLLLGICAGAGAESKPYVEFVSSTAMRITPKYTNSGVTLQYSLNKTTWTTIATGVATPSANVIYFRGQATGTKSLFTSKYIGISTVPNVVPIIVNSTTGIFIAVRYA